MDQQIINQLLCNDEPALYFLIDADLRFPSFVLGICSQTRVGGSLGVCITSDIGHIRFAVVGNTFVSPKDKSVWHVVRVPFLKQMHRQSKHSFFMCGSIVRFDIDPKQLDAHARVIRATREIDGYEWGLKKYNEKDKETSDALFREFLAACIELTNK